MMKKAIDLRSDTITKPTPSMLEAMFSAEVGDDVFGEDPTILSLEEKTAKMFGMEAALFCPSGTMANQIAIKVHTRPLDEVICDKESHIYVYEGGGMMFHSGVSVKLIEGDRGLIAASDIVPNINPDDIHYAHTRLVCIENTCNRGGGSVYSHEAIKDISRVCKENSLALHLDGARIFNALMVSDMTSQSMGAYFDSISVCLSKGLGAPVGSVLLGSAQFIHQATRMRKVMGGGMRQAGYLAAAGIYALDHHIDRLQDDHRRAKIIGEKLSGLPFIKEVKPIDTNILIFSLHEGMTADMFLSKLEAKHVLALAFGPQMVRMVTHLDFDEQDLDRLLQILETL